MANPFQEQLLKAGLVDEKRVKKVRHDEARKRKGKAGNQADTAPDPALKAAEEARRLEAERSRELNRRQKEAAERRALEAQVRQLVDTHRQSREGAELPYHFQHGTAVRRILVTREQRDRLGNGRLGIVTLDDEHYDIVPRDAAEKIRERDASRLVLLNEPAQKTEKDEDDPYAGYEVPDDLMW